MTGFGDTSLNLFLKEYIFEQIGDYIVYCCEKMNDDLKRKKDKIQNDENKIRNHLLENYLIDNSLRYQQHMEMFLFIPEVPENYNKRTNTSAGRVDIKIIHQQESFSNAKAVYFVECKRIDGTAKLNREYVKNGISRFVITPPHYSSFYSKNFMLGFIVAELNIEDNIKKIEAYQEDETRIFNKTSFIKTLRNRYNCDYIMNKKIIKLHHIFIDFTDVIDDTKIID